MKTGNTQPPLAESQNDAVALFMHRYGSTLPPQNAAGQDSPGQLDKKCLSLIRREFALHRQKIAAGKALSATRRIAAFLVLIGLFLFAAPRQSTAAPDANPAMPDIPKTPEWSIRTEYDPNADYPLPPYSPDPLHGIISEDFKITESGGDSFDAFYVTYTASDGQLIGISSIRYGGTINYNLENAVSVKPFSLNGQFAAVIEHESYALLFWHKDSIACKMLLFAKNAPADELIQIAFDYDAKISNQ